MYFTHSLSLSCLSDILGAQILGSVQDIDIIGLCSPDNPQSGCLCYLDNSRFIPRVAHNVTAILSRDIPALTHLEECIFFISEDPKLSWIQLLIYLKKHAMICFDSFNNTKSLADSKVAKSAQIYPGAYIAKGCSIGERSVVYPNAVLYNNVHLGQDVIIHSGAVIGADGFGFYDKQSIRYSIPHLAGVVLDDHVEVGANSTIDAGIIEPTRIGAYTKIDNLVHIAHQCQIGSYCYIAAQSGLAGSVKLGNRVKIAGQVGIIDHVSVGDDCVILVKSLVTRSVHQGHKLLGIPAQDAFRTKRLWAHLKRC